MKLLRADLGVFLDVDRIVTFGEKVTDKAAATPSTTAITGAKNAARGRHARLRLIGLTNAIPDLRPLWRRRIQ